MKPAGVGRHGSSIASFHERLLAGEVSCEEVVTEELKNIDGYAKKHNAFITVLSGKNGLALSRARELDGWLAKRGGAPLPPLFGVPLTIKDNTFLGGFPTTDACKAFLDYVPTTNADVIDQLLGAGCIPLGKTNLHELAIGIMGTSGLGGPIHNAVDPERISGGSSGGSAVSVALSRGPILSTGTDTGGSVRVPAALNGVCGFKPSHGLLSTEGVFPLGGSLDHMGLFAKSTPDLALGFRTLTGSSPAARRKRVLGIPSSYFTDDMDSKVSKDFWRTLDDLKESGEFATKDVEATGDFTRYARARAVIMLKEGAWFYESILRSPETRKEIHPDVLALMDRGRNASVPQYVRSLGAIFAAGRSMSRMMRDVDLLAMPSCLIVPPKIDEILGKETGSFRTLMLRNAELFNLTGLPALSLPMSRGGLPTGLQLVGHPGEDEEVLTASESAWDVLHGSGAH